MFSAAFTIASEFTKTVVTSWLQHDGECKSGMGAFVVLNDEGWFVTAWHIIDNIQKFEQEIKTNKDALALRKSIFDNKALKESEKQKQLKQIIVPNTAIIDYSTWWGWDGVSAQDLLLFPEADLAIGRLVNFNPDHVRGYPKIKDPSKGMPIATSLCKLGFPFHEIKPTFDSSTKTFNLPPGSAPAPFFPLEGIFTRNLNVTGAPVRQYSVMFLETSSPGIPGQSGGPTFDIHGTVWALQVQTNSQRLTFGNNYQGDPKQKEILQSQYLHVGWGVHAETLVGFLNEHNIRFELSSH